MSQFLGLRVVQVQQTLTPSLIYTPAYFSMDMTVSSPDNDASIRYTYTKTQLFQLPEQPEDPTESSTEYTASLELTPNSHYWFKAIAFKSGKLPSQISQLEIDTF